MAMPVNFDIKTARFPEFVDAMEAVEYYPTDLTALQVTHSQLRAMERSARHKGPVIGVLADGKPGVGKSYLAQCLAQLLDAEYIVYNCHPDSTSEELISEPNAGAVVSALMGIEHGVINFQQLPAGTATPHGQTLDARKELSRAELYNMGQLLQAFVRSDLRKVIILLDELDKARSAVDTVLLTAMSEGVLYLQGWGENGEVLAVPANRNNLMLIAAKNQNRELEEALYRRFPVIEVGYPPKDVEIKMIMKGAGVGEEVAKYLVRVATKMRRSKSVKKEPSFPELKRLAQDFKGIWEMDCEPKYKDLEDGTKEMYIFCHVPFLTLFGSSISTFQPRPKERDISLQVINPKGKGKKPTFIGSQLLSKFAVDEYKGKGDIPKIRYISEQRILSKFMKS